MSKITITPPRQEALEKVKQEMVILGRTMLPRLLEFRVTTEDELVSAGAALQQIAKARKTIKERIDPILDPINVARNATLALRKELDDPWEEAEKHIRSEQKEFRIAENRRIAEEQRIKAEKEEELRQEAEEKARKAEQARTPQMASRLAAQSQMLVNQADQVAYSPESTSVRAAGAGVRRVDRWRLQDMRLLAKAVGEGKVPIEVLMVSSVQMNMYFRTNKPEVVRWPGIEVYEDIQVVNR